MDRWFHALPPTADAKPDRERPAFRIAIVAAMLLVGVMSASPIFAASPDEATTSFDIPAQPLATAIERFMSATNVTVLADSLTIARRMSTAVEGGFTPDAALFSLLAGTGLEPQAIGADAYTLVPAPRTAAVHALPRFIDYAAAIQQAVTTALCRQSDTRPTHYRAVMRLWLDPSGMVTRVGLGSSTGTSGLDAAIIEAVSRVDIGQPSPPGLPQPVKLAIVPQAATDCPPVELGR